jgi:hypothetical protein
LNVLFITQLFLVTNLITVELFKVMQKCANNCNIVY